MKELVVVSGKGGTGKTSLTACFAVMAGSAVVADCDVDAPDLHLLLAPQTIARHEFRSGRQATIRPADCTGCGACAEACRFGAIRSRAGSPRYSVDPVACEGCGVCVDLCPSGAVDFHERVCGEWMVSLTRCGTLVHARLAVGGENSGRLVSTVRREARLVGERSGAEILIVDGPPGIGCPVIASLTGADLALVVTEPTVSGEHDLGRLLALADHFRVPIAVCVNKWDINPELAQSIETASHERGVGLAGRIGYDPGVTRAQQDGRTAVEAEAPSAGEIAAVWDRVLGIIGEVQPLSSRPVSLGGARAPRRTLASSTIAKGEVPFAGPESGSRPRRAGATRR